LPLQRHLLLHLLHLLHLQLLVVMAENQAVIDLVPLQQGCLHFDDMHEEVHVSRKTPPS